MAISADAQDCAGCVTHPSLLPEVAVRRSVHARLKKVALIFGVGVFGLATMAAMYIGVTLYKIDHAVHHIALPQSLLAKGDNDLLAVVRGPEHHEEFFVFRTAHGHTNVLSVPSALGVEVAAGKSVPLSSLSIDAPAPIISGLRHLGIPVGRYLGVDLSSVSPTSSLGRLALGTASITSLISHPAGTTSLMEAVASHVFLGPHTPVSSLLDLMQVPAANPVSVPTWTTPNGQVVLAAPAVDVLRHFL
jgi:hypothetical protein